jgi:hypothetical protein
VDPASLQGWLDLAERLVLFASSPPPVLVIALLWAGVPALAFIAVQSIKRIAPQTRLARRLTDLEVRGVACLLTLVLTQLAGVGLAELPADKVAIHGVLVSIAYPFVVMVWLEWLRRHNPQAYWRYSGRRDRRTRDAEPPGGEYQRDSDDEHTQHTGLL